MFAGVRPDREHDIVGGLQVSLDLSKAFDLADRSMLGMALRDAGISEDIVSVILALHASCEYNLTQGSEQASTRTTNGIRQGCTLAPTLWICYSCYLYRRISECLSAATTAGITLFADDNHVSWMLTAEKDLHHAVTQLGAFLALLAEMRLQVNPGKSKCLLLMHGPKARSLRKQYVTIIQNKPHLRVPHPGFGSFKPFLIPLCTSFRYLGMEVTYGNFGSLTLRHNIAQAKARYSQMRKLLAGKHCLTQASRVQLWRACLQPVFLTGLHLCCLTPTEVQELRVAMVRQVRAITRCPVHLTGVSTEALLQKHDLKDPLYLLSRRCNNLLDSYRSLAYMPTAKTFPDTWVETHLHLVADYQGLACNNGSPQAVIPVTEPALTRVACPVCGLYFLDDRGMRIHRAKKHPDAVPGRAALDAHSCAVAGLPQCRFCSMSFSHWGPFKQHVSEHACPGLREMAEARFQLQSTDRQAVRTDATCSLVDGSLFQDQDVRALLSSSSFADAWTIICTVRSFRRRLMQRCALCNQWIADYRAVKTHWKRIHVQEWQDHHCAAVRLGARCLALSMPSKGQPCWACLCPVASKGHNRQCTAAFQACVLQLLLRPGSAQAPLSLTAHSRRPLALAHDDGSSRGTGLLGLAPQRGHSTEKGGVRGDAGDGRSTTPYHPAQQKEEKSVAAVNALYRYGIYGNAAQSRRQDTEAGQEANQRGPGDGSSLGSPDGDQARGPRSDRAFVLHMANQTPGIIAPLLKVTKRWQEMREATPDQVRLPLRCLVMDCILMEMEARLAELQNTPAAMTAVRNQGRLNAENQWIMEKWSPALQRLVKDEQRTPMDFDRTVELLAKLRAGFQEPATLLRCHATRAITENMTKPTTVFLIEVSLRGCQGGRALRLRQAALWTFGFVPHRSTASAGGHEAEPCLSGAAKDPEPPSRSVAQKDRSALRDPVSGAHPGSTTTAPVDLVHTILQARLLNPGNHCYINASITACVWALSSSPVAFLPPQLQHAIQPLLHVFRCAHQQPISLYRSLAFVMLGWLRPHIQHDVADFYMYLHNKLGIQHWAGKWEARTIEAGVEGTTDGGYCALVPISLHTPPDAAENTLQSLIACWHSQREMYALQEPAPFVVLALPRFKRHDSGWNKDGRTYRVTRQDVYMPVFTTPTSLHVDWHAYRVCSIVIHDGRSCHEGHYRALLRTGHGWVLKDDDTRPQLVRVGTEEEHASFCGLVDQRGYIVFLTRQIPETLSGIVE